MGEAAVGVCAECMRWLACRARTRTRTRTPPRARAPFPSSSSCTRVMTRVCHPSGSRKDAKTPSGLAVLARRGTRETQHPLLASTHRVRAPSRLCALARGSSNHVAGTGGESGRPPSLPSASAGVLKSCALEVVGIRYGGRLCLEVEPCRRSQRRAALTNRRRR